jgi:ureidoacrylate peracid hydrolase
MAPADGETVLEGKRALSAFTNTQLGELLAKNSIKNLVLAGFLTNVCLEATARSAYDLGYHVTIASDASGTTSQANQEYVEREVAPVLGQAKRVDEILEDLNAGVLS